MNKTTEAFEAWWSDTGEQSLYALNTTTDDDIKILAGLAWEAAIREVLAEPVKQEPVAVEQSAPYGFCPICRRAGVSRERGINGNDTCVIGHKYASSEAIPAEPVKQEPVAVISESAIGLVKLHSNGACLPFGTQLYAAPVDAKAIRALKLVYDNSTSHDWPECIWNAIVDALYEEHRKTMARARGEK